MPYFVYILQSQKTKKYYVGFSANLGQRLKDHNAGRTQSLQKHIPLEIIKVEEYSTYEEARGRERQIKSYKSGEGFKKLIQG